MRRDGGSAETGTGLEVGGGVRIDYPAWGLKGDVHAQGLVMHTADEFTEWGVSALVQVGRRTEGMMVRVRPSWGPARSMYGRQTIQDVVPVGADAYRTEVEWGYGVPWKDGTARSIVGVTQMSQGRVYRLGGEFHPADPVSFSVFGLMHGQATLGVNVRGMLQY
ncbi:MAG: hypothetical protein F4Z16_08535 [Rhodothermaceae bacterium]|nr:hypothetical protein [Rhodothermaceae bacterium]